VASEWKLEVGCNCISKYGTLDKPWKDVTGSLYGGSGLCLERWQFEKLQFFEVTDQVEEVAKMAQQASNEMY